MLYRFIDDPEVWASLIAQLVKNLPAMQETLVRFLVGKIRWRRDRLPTPVFLPRKFRGQRSLAGYRAYLVAQLVKNLPAMQESQV